MKIGILTFHCADNFGAVLQCYSLRKCLCSYKKIDAEVINYCPKHMTDRYRNFPSSKEIFNKIKDKGFFYTWKNMILVAIKTYKDRVSKKRKFDLFRNKYIEIKKTKYRKASEIKEKYDIVIVGSDQVWNPVSNREDTAYYLDFVHAPTKKVSYAASVGITDISKYKDDMMKYLSKFDKISVREKSAISTLQTIIDKDIDVVVDPVFLTNREEWDKLIDNMKLFEQPFIFLYCFNKDDKAIELVNALSKKYDLPIIHFYYGGLRNKLYKDGKCYYFEGPLEFLWYIKNAQYVVTNSFHCAAFSVIFEKEVFCYLFKDRGSRTVDLLNSLGLEQRLCADKTTNDIIDNYKEIDYKEVNDRLSKLKNNSFRYIEDILKLC